MLYALIDPSGNACQSHVPYGGYSYETLKDMEAHGYSLTIDGIKAKFPTKAELAQAQTAPKKKYPGGFI